MAKSVSINDKRTSRGERRKPFIISISGTPCSGKTTLANKLSLFLHASYVDVNKIIKKYALSEGYDYRRKCQIVAISKLKRAIFDYISHLKGEKIIVIDSHMSHYLPKNKVDLCIITEANLKTLKSRLKKRGYSEKKVGENLTSAIMQICLNEAKEVGHDILLVTTTRAPVKTAKLVADYILTLI